MLTTHDTSVEMLYSAMLAHQQLQLQRGQFERRSLEPMRMSTTHASLAHASLTHASLTHDATHAPRFSVDPNMRRKNATRESTSILKSWLGEHRKNPYPTKGEKIMLAIITKMTLTQVR